MTDLWVKGRATLLDSVGDFSISSGYHASAGVKIRIAKSLYFVIDGRYNYEDEFLYNIINRKKVKLGGFATLFGIETTF